MIVDCAVYTKGERQPGVLNLEDALETARAGPDNFVWIGLYEPTNDEFADVATEFELHPLAVEDAVTAHQRPKLELYGSHLFVVAKTARYDDASESIEFAEIQIFAGEGFVVTVRHGAASPLAAVRHDLEDDPARCRLGPLSVVHAILDRVVDDYTPVLDGLDTDIVEAEGEVFAPERTNPAERIYRLKRSVLDLYRSIEPLLDALTALRQGKHPFEGQDLEHYFRDVEDHVHKAVSRAEGDREMLSDALNVNLAQIAVGQNQDMRTISGWAAIAAVPTMLAGVWGMNFDHMPELDEWWGYPLALTLMACAAFGIWRVLRKRGWL
ncbi:MAG TPA: magnesium and cobalt transport protein CorA [Acidimicrobiales bacterium]|nr:magnesium and cobalt transport protein CorA [Acidimicrobiales bacterium]